MGKINITKTKNFYYFNLPYERRTKDDGHWPMAIAHPEPMA